MKSMKWLLLVVVCLAIPVFAQAPKAAKEDPEFVEARRLFWSGQYKEAEAMFEEYLAAHPDHEASRSFLQMIAQSRIYNPAKIDETRQRLDRLRIQKMEFKDEDWKKVISILQNAANPKVNGQEPANVINFINLLPTTYSPRVTITLQDMTLMEAIDKVTRQTGLRYVIDTYAVIIDLPEGKK